VTSNDCGKVILHRPHCQLRPASFIARRGRTILGRLRLAGNAEAGAHGRKALLFFGRAEFADDTLKQEPAGETPALQIPLRPPRLGDGQTI